MRHCRRNTAQESVEETRALLQPRRAGEICVAVTSASLVALTDMDLEL